MLAALVCCAVLSSLAAPCSASASASTPSAATDAGPPALTPSLTAADTAPAAPDPSSQDPPLDDPVGDSHTGKPDVGYAFPGGGFLGTYRVNGQGTFCIDLNGSGPSTASGYHVTSGTKVRTQVGWTADHKGGTAASITGPWLTELQLGQLAYVTDRYAETSSALTASAAEHVIRLLTVGDKAQATRETVRWKQAVAAHPLLAKTFPVMADDVAKHAGPYKPALTWATAPSVTTPGVLAVQVLSAAGVPVPGVTLTVSVSSSAGSSTSSATTGTGGTAKVTIPVRATGTLSVAVTTARLAAATPLLYLPKKYSTPGTTDYAAQRTVGRSARIAVSASVSATIAAAVPTVAVSVPTAKAYPGDTIGATLTVGGTVSAYSGTATATLWGPLTAKPTANSCAAPTSIAGTVSVAVTGDGTFPVPGIAVTDPGYYAWSVVLPGSALQAAVTSVCGASTATAQVLPPATPKVSTASTPTSVLPSGTVTDTLTVSGSAPSYAGTATATLWGPFVAKPTATSCTGATQAGQVTVAVTGNGAFTTPSVTLITSGYYTWTDDLTATAAQAAFTTTCGADVVQVLPPATPKITQKATPGSPAVGGTVTDTLTIKGTVKGFTGTATATLWGPYPAKPTATDCAPTDSQAGQVTVAVPGDGSMTTPAVTVSAPGYYTWTTNLPGTTAQADVTTVCGEATAAVTVTATPTVSIAVTGPLLIGTDASGTITLTDSFPGLSLKATATLYGPFAAVPGATSCTTKTKVTASTVPLSGDNSYSTDPITPTLVGYYSWTVSVPKDAAQAAVAQACGDPAGTFQVVRADLGALTVNNTGSAGASAPSGTTAGKGPVLSIPSASINAPLVRVGLLAPGIATPADPSLAGEVDVAAHAGEAAGTIVVAGRASDPNNAAGALFRLPQVATGAQITLKDPVTGVTQKFTVTAVQTYPRSQALPASLFTQTDTPLRLVILSATDPVWYGGGTQVTYRSNVVVIATAS